MCRSDRRFFNPALVMGSPSRLTQVSVFTLPKCSRPASVTVAPVAKCRVSGPARPTRCFRSLSVTLSRKEI